MIRDLGVWSHYVGDASQPLHVSEHFDGWGPFPNPCGFSTAKGIHANFEGAFVRPMSTGEAVAGALSPLRLLGPDRARALILESQGLVVAFYELEQKGAFTDRTEPSALLLRRGWPRAPRRCAT